MISTKYSHLSNVELVHHVTAMGFSDPLVQELAHRVPLTTDRPKNAVEGASRAADNLRKMVPQ